VMNSIIQSKKECYVCHRQGVLHKHHVFGGSNRKNSERYGMTVWLCPADHNMSDKGIHFNRKLDLRIKCACQEKWLQSGRTKEEFIRIFGKWWIR